MRLLFVVQRYGREVAGGAELHCREFATRLAARGHQVDVLTSRALSYVDWADHYPAGPSALDGVTVHRLGVAAPRPDHLFGPLNARVVWAGKPVPLYLQHEWMRMQGPYLPELAPWLDERAGRYDVVIFFTYLYYPTWAGLPAAARRARTLLHPTAHEEPALELELFDTTLRHPSGFAFSTAEEAELIRRRTGGRPAGAVIGIGVDLEPPDQDEERFRRAFGLADRPYLLFVGRLDPAKGSEELYEFFVAYKQRNPGPLTLAIVGDPVRPLPPHPEVVVAGYVDEAMKQSALAGALALVQPSYFESFSMVLTEAWVRSKPALVQGRCAVLEGQARRSGGGLPYRGFAEFEAALDRLADDPALARRMGERGRSYVEAHYRWDVVLDRYERLLHATMGRPPAALSPGPRG